MYNICCLFILVIRDCSLFLHFKNEGIIRNFEVSHNRYLYNITGVYIYNLRPYRHGRAAGPIRNEEIAEVSDALIAFWDGKSRGTKSMIEIARRKGLQVAVVRYDL